MIYRSMLLAGCALVAAGGVAQAAATDAVDVGEVVVTAQRRAEKLENVPMSVTAISPDAISKSGVSSVHDLNQLVAGAQINFAGCCTQPAIRGISTLTTGVGFENNVAIYIDGFYSPDNITINMDFANISSIEVLKGPQGTLWGRNATGGAILINTKSPSKTLTGSFEAGYGRYNEFIAGAYLSGPITDRVRYSIAAYNRTSDGYNKWIKPDGTTGHFTPLKQQSVRLKLEADVTDDLTATFGYNYGFSADARGNVFQPFQHVTPAIPAPPARSITPYVITANVRPNVPGMVNEGTMKLTYGTPIGTLTSYTGVAYRMQKLVYDFDGSFLDFIRSYGKYNETTFQQTFDYNITAIDNVDLIIGGTYMNDRWKNLYSYSISNNRYNSVNHWTQITEAYAGYIDGTYHFNDRLSLNLGVRYSHDKKEMANYSQGPDGRTITVPLVRSVANFHAITPRASIRYEIAPRTNVYASYSQGYRTGGFNPVPGISNPFDPEKIKSYEVGFKTVRGSFRFNAAGFYYDYTNMQVGVTIPNPNPLVGGVTNFILNAKAAEIYGVDGNFEWEPVERLHVRGGVAWLHGRYTDFHNATGVGLNPVTDRDVTQSPGTPPAQDLTGLQMARAPKWSGNLGVDYEIEGVLGGQLIPAANLTFTTAYPLSNPSVFGPLVAPELQRKQRFKGSSYALINAQLTWVAPSERYRATVWVNNITNNHHKLTFNGNAATGDYASYSEPVSYGVRVGYNF